MPRNRTIALILACALVAPLTACSKTPDAVSDSREALGTIVSVTAYPSASTDASQAADALNAVYDRIASDEAILDAYRSDEWNNDRQTFGYNSAPSTNAESVLDFNTNPLVWRTLPAEVSRILERIDGLDVKAYFSPALFEVEALYGFEASETVPPDDLLSYYVALANTFEVQTAGTGNARFDVEKVAAPTVESNDPRFGQLVRVGIDLGGAAKGYALDDAVRDVQKTGAIDSALITAGSTTVTFGDKPDGEKWHIGVEDPRDPEKVIATIDAAGTVAVSTSGDYQRYFEADGVRYHHILDPMTGKPARGLRSLTVVGARSGLDSDILSTALFVMGPDKAVAYAEENGLGLFLVDDQGQTRIVPGPEGANFTIAEATE